MTFCHPRYGLISPWWTDRLVTSGTRINPKRDGLTQFGGFFCLLKMIMASRAFVRFASAHNFSHHVQIDI